MENENNKQKVKVSVTKKTDLTLVLGMDWMKKFKLTIGGIQFAENRQLERRKYSTDSRTFSRTTKRQKNRDKHPVETGTLPSKTKSQTGTSTSTSTRRRGT